MWGFIFFECDMNYQSAGPDGERMLMYNLPENDVF